MVNIAFLEHISCSDLSELVLCNLQVGVNHCLIFQGLQVKFYFQETFLCCRTSMSVGIHVQFHCIEECVNLNFALIRDCTIMKQIIVSALIWSSVLEVPIMFQLVEF